MSFNRNPMAGTVEYSSSTSSFGTSIVIATILSSLALGLLFTLCFLRWIYARIVRRLRGQQSPQLIVTITAPQFPSHDAPKTGLDPAVIAALPMFVYKTPGQIDGTSTIECSICLSTIEEEEMVRLLPNCLHFFHAQCIDMWLSSHSTCPICRAVAEPQAPPVSEQEPEAQSHGTGDDLVPSIVPPLNSVTAGSEDASYETAQSSKVDASSSRPSSFENILSWNGSGRRIQPFELSSAGVEDPEKQ